MTVTFVLANFMVSPFVITIVGPESSGKTTLARELAARIGCCWLPEHARVFLSYLDHPYTFRDLETLAVIQYNLIQRFIREKSGLPDGMIQSLLKHMMSKQAGLTIEDLAAMLRPVASGVVIIDGGMLTLQQWAAIKYGETIEVVENALQADLTTCYILARARKAWEPDPLREAPDYLDRVWIFNRYLQALQRSGSFYVTGNVDVIHDRTA
jgi:nicotinamide riboside kinase